MLVCRLSPSNAEEYRAMMLRAYADAPEAFTATVPERERMPLEWWTARVSDLPEPEQLVIGAYDDHRLVGVAGLRFHRRERTAHKTSLFGVSVLPEARGRGIARALVEAVLAEARSAPGIRIVQLGFIAPNAAALRLYESSGFVSFGTEPYAIKDGNQFRSIVHMWQEVEPRAA
jgi:ribosomal protein S18 acetylase RimI-like enzyme